mgnify:CR=1 FL=1
MTSTKSITRPWHPYPQETCSFGKDGCEEPGYFVQWPYMQKQSGEVRIASAVTNECTRKSENAEYWVWDPFLQTLREEYYTCDKEVIAFEEKWSNTTDATESPYKVAFHVDMKYYQKMHFTTMTCMKSRSFSLEVQTLMQKTTIIEQFYTLFAVMVTLKCCNCSYEIHT